MSRSDYPSALDIPTIKPTPDQASGQDRASFLRKTKGIDEALSFKIQGCGTYGTLRLVSLPDGSRQLQGAGCGSTLCPTCGPKQALAAAQQLSDVVRHLTCEGGISPDRFVWGAVTMAKWHGSLMERMELLGGTLEAAVNQRWWKRLVLGYEFAQDYSGTGSIHGHWHVFLVLAPGADMEAFKAKLHSFFQDRIGSHLVQWDSDVDHWNDWLQVARLSPTVYRYHHGHVWKHAHEIEGCHTKPCKRGTYKNLYDRSRSDLAQIIPVMRRWDTVRRGGIISTTRKHLGLGARIKKTIADHGSATIPAAFWNQVEKSAQQTFLHLVADPSTPAGLITDLVTLADFLSPEGWGAAVEEALIDPDPTGEYAAAEASLTLQKAPQAPQGHRSPAPVPSAAPGGSQRPGRGGPKASHDPSQRRHRSSRTTNSRTANAISTRRSSFRSTRNMAVASNPLPKTRGQPQVRAPVVRSWAQAPENVDAVTARLSRNRKQPRHI